MGSLYTFWQPKLSKLSQHFFFDLVQELSDSSGTFISQMDAHHERMTAWQEGMKANQDATEVCLEKTEACLESKEPTTLEVESKVEHEEVPKEDAAVETGRAPNKRHADWNLATGRCGKPKEQTQGKGECQKKLAGATKMIHHAGVVWSKGQGHKGRCHQGHGRDNVAPGAQKGRTFGRRHWTRQECNNGITDQGLRQ
jgi:hypothetical protein